MTETIFGNELFNFRLVHVPSAYMVAAGFMTYAAASPPPKLLFKCMWIHVAMFEYTVVDLNLVANWE